MASAQATAGTGLPVTIDGEQLRSLVAMPDAIEASRRGFAAAANGEVTGSLRSALSQHRVLVMPVEHRSGDALVKVISVQPSGWKEGLPSVGGGALWIDGGTGRITAMLDATALTAMRTGAASGLATGLLAPPEASVLAMLGAGGQAADQVDAVCAVRPIRQIRVFSRGQGRRETLSAQLAARYPRASVLPVAQSAEAVRGADVICAATRSRSPLFALTDLGENVHINAVGAYDLSMCEVPPEAFGQAAIVVIDQMEAAMAEAGDVVQAISAGMLRPEGLVEIGRLLDGRQPPAGGITIFKSVGIAAQDWALAELVVRRAGTSPGSLA